MPGSHDWRSRAASQITQQLPDNTADPLALRDAAVRHIWPKAEYERALDLINRGYEKLIVAQIIGRTIKELNNKLHYEQMEESKRQQRREQIDELRKRALNTLTGHARIPRPGTGGRTRASTRARGTQGPAGGRVSRPDVGVLRGSAAGLQPAKSQRQGLTLR